MSECHESQRVYVTHRVDVMPRRSRVRAAQPVGERPGSRLAAVVEALPTDGEKP